MRRKRGSIVVPGVALAILAACCVSSASASGTTLYVATTGTDTGNCQTSSTPCRTIGYALGQAPSAATIQIATGTYDENVGIGGSISLVGASQTGTVIDGGAAGTTVTVIAAGGTVNLTNLTITDGQAAQGGGITSTAQALNLSHVTISGNTATPPPSMTGGNPGKGGGIYVTAGAVTIANSKIMGNHAIGQAGKAGMKNSGGPGTNGGNGLGGGIYDAGAPLTLTDTTVTKNSAKGGKGGAGGSWDSGTPGTGGNGGDGGTAEGGGIYFDDAALSLTGSKVDSNTAQAGGGGNGGSASPGTGGDGGAADAFFDAGNPITGGAGIFGGGPSYFGHAVSLTLTSSDVSSNSTKGGSGGTGGSGSQGGGPGGVWTSCGNTRGGGILMTPANGTATGNLTITSSTVDDNTLTGCNGGKGGAGANGAQDMPGAPGGRGGDTNPAWGGAFFYLTVSGENLDITTSTISGNTLTTGHGGDGGKGGNGGTASPGKAGQGGGAGGGGGYGNNAFGGAVAYASSSAGNVTITGSTIASNVATSGNGGAGGAGGGGSAGSTGQPGGNGGSGGAGGGTNPADGGGIWLNASAAITISDATLAANSATGGNGGTGGAGGDGGGGTPTGLSGSSGAGQNGGDGLGGALWSPDLMALTNVTVAGNSAVGGIRGNGNPSGVIGNGEGGGLYAGSVHLGNDIVATNTVSNGAAAGPDCNTNTGSATTMGHNLIGDISFCSGITAGTDGDQAGNGVTPLDPLLGALADNGGPAQTMALNTGSPAIAHGDPTLCSSAPVNDVDQRGYPRRSSARVTCDVGAYDTAEPVSFSVGAPPTANTGQSFSVTVTAKDAFGGTLTTYIGKISFSSTDSTATLPKAYTFKAADHGVHTFTVTLATAGSQTVSVKDKDAKSVKGTSAPIAVSP